MAVIEVSSGEMNRRKVVDEVYIALLEILKEGQEAVSARPFQSLKVESNEMAEKAWVAEDDSLYPEFSSQDVGYPFILCDGVYLIDILHEPLVYRSQLRTLGGVLREKVAAYDANQDWLNVKLVDEIFSIRATSQAGVSLLEEVQARTLAVIDAIELYKTLKKICLSPGQLRIYLSDNDSVLEAAGVKFTLTFLVTHTDWMFEPILTHWEQQSYSSALMNTWYSHAIIQALYRLILGGGSLQMETRDDRGGFTLSVETLMGVEYLGAD